jgi:DNA-binding LytR/AlgR family response regulator
MFVKDNKVLHKISFDEIQYIEGCGNFIKIITDKKEVMHLEKMKNIENLLPNDRFIRVHKSYIVSISKIEEIEGNRIINRNKIIPVGKHYRINLEKIINKYSIKHK